MEKYKNKYRIPSARLQGYDYGRNGTYFITICTQDREHFFGKVVDQKMILNKLGQLAEKYWIEIPDHFPFVQLGNLVVMPNHVHGVLIIDNGDGVETLQCNVSTDPGSKNGQMSHISPKPGTISTIIRSYKSVVSKYARQMQGRFSWQPRFYDHIIRNAQSFERIQTYIENNPLNWKEDRFYSNSVEII